MQARLFATLLAALVVGRSVTLNAQAAATVCKDGTTTTTTGKGACSGHGGVDGKATAAAKSATKEASKAARKTAAEVTCTDGTLSKSGKGACSGHGGVQRTRSAPPSTTTPTPPTATLPAAVPATSPARTRSEAKSNAPSATKASTSRSDNADSVGAIAQCKDGLYSHAATRRGACSRHGGVAKFLKL